MLRKQVSVYWNLSCPFTQFSSSVVTALRPFHLPLLPSVCSRDLSSPEWARCRLRRADDSASTTAESHWPDRGLWCGLLRPYSRFYWHTAAVGLTCPRACVCVCVCSRKKSIRVLIARVPLHWKLCFMDEGVGRRSVPERHRYLSQLIWVQREWTRGQEAGDENNKKSS